MLNKKIQNLPVRVVKRELQQKVPWNETKRKAWLTLRNVRFNRKYSIVSWNLSQEIHLFLVNQSNGKESVLTSLGGFPV